MRPSIPTITTAVQPTAPVEKSRRFRRAGGAEIRRWTIIAGLTGIVAVGLLIGSLIAAIYLQARSDESRRVDAIVVLGSAQYNGVPSPDLRARLDTALAAYESGLAPYIVVTGGKMQGDIYTEADASMNYLLDRGVPDSALLIEDQGSNSWESMQGASVVLQDAGLSSVLLVSDGFHLFRVKLMAKKLGLSAFGVAAEDSPIRKNSWNEFSYVVREAGATIKFVQDQML